MNRKVSLIVISLLAIFLLTACNVRVMWRGNNTFKHTQAKYAYFTGSKVKSFGMEAGETIVLEYASEVKSGNLTIIFYGPNDEELLQIPTNTSGTKTFKIEQSGRYTLKIIGERTKGSYDLSWKVK